MRTWFEQRLGLISALARCNEGLSGPATWGRSLGAMLVYLIALQSVVGVYLALYYSPSVSDAWASVAYLQDQVAGGWFLRGLHHHGMTAFVVVLALHGIRATWRAAYRAPGELAWLTGLALVLPVFGFALSGYFLTFDQNAYWAAQVRMGVAQGVPGGGLVNQVLIGGVELGNLSLVRAYVLHVLVLPTALVFTTGLHILAVVRARRRAGVAVVGVATYYPNQAARDLVAMSVLAACLVVATLSSHGAPLGGPADPNSSFVARPEWFFLPLYQLLHLLNGQWQVVGSAVLPALLALGAGLLPWLDRRARGERPVAARWVKLALALVLAGATGLSAIAVNEDATDPEYAKAVVVQEDAAATARRWAREGVLPEGGMAVFRNDPDYRALDLYRQHCATCHRLGAQGGDEAPALDQLADREWLAGLIRDPNDARFFGGTKHRDMDPYPEKDLPNVDLAALVEYIVSLRQEPHATFDVALAAKGRSVFVDQGCEDCHEVRPGVAGDGPNLYGHGSRVFIARVIADPSAGDLYGESAEMPGFAKKITPAEIALLADYLARQREGEPTVEAQVVLAQIEAQRVAASAGKPADSASTTDDTTTATAAGSASSAAPSKSD